MGTGTVERRGIGAQMHRIAMAAAGAFLIGGCGGGGILPLATLPPAGGPPPEYPSLVVPVSYEEDAPPLLNSAEIERMEEQLGRLPKDREAAVRRRILQAR
jgi:hypothetical protein